MTALVLIGIAAFYVMMGTDIIPRRIERLRYRLRCGVAWFRHGEPT
jgi:hypothetical protein